MKRKIAVMCVLALTGTMMLTACGNKKDSNNGKTSDGKTAIRFATWDVAGDCRLRGDLFIPTCNLIWIMPTEGMYTMYLIEMPPHLLFFT